MFFMDVKPKRKYDMKADSEKISNGVKHVQKVLLKRFKTLEKTKSVTPADLDTLVKLGNAIGYMSQVHGGLAKTVEHEKRIIDIEKAIEIRKLKNMPEWGR